MAAQDTRIEIVEQPDSKAIRFRYECEQRSTATILGERTVDGVKSYPAIRIPDYEGEVAIFVSCVEMSPVKSSSSGNRKIYR